MSSKFSITRQSYLLFANHAKKLPSLQRKGTAVAGGWFSLVAAECAIFTALEMKYQRRRTDAHNLPELRTFRTELRSHLTPAEAAFWNIVKTRSWMERSSELNTASKGTYLISTDHRRDLASNLMVKPISPNSLLNTIVNESYSYSITGSR